MGFPPKHTFPGIRLQFMKPEATLNVFRNHILLQNAVIEHELRGKYIQWKWNTGLKDTLVMQCIEKMDKADKGLGASARAFK